MRVTKTYLQQELTKAQNELKGLHADFQRFGLEHESILAKNEDLVRRLTRAEENLQRASELIHQSNAALFLLIEKMPGIND